ncbi:uncharacterized protein F5Z01DRAFT_479820 [Emericellopsis atlantica]|uniref:Secreted protein n=1 Tax=Emericellopsis atlantica TaxID=2614577 RepID=A0A9P7ZQU0_9HYPO|nr:uncharacterized protein F5Z01DRAFT_479820 [Emericellopsis atlantica]KAG9256613.1 hypothetical protein F5Z01DRAFT_479820 [Emericellopsis atlantica]
MQSLCLIRSILVATACLGARARPGRLARTYRRRQKVNFRELAHDVSGIDSDLDQVCGRVVSYHAERVLESPATSNPIPCPVVLTKCHLP